MLDIDMPIFLNRPPAQSDFLMAAYPNLDQFLSAPVDDVRRVAPATLILTNGGTRRRAVVAGVSPADDEYARWTRQANDYVSCPDISSMVYSMSSQRFWQSRTTMR